MKRVYNFSAGPSMLPEAVLAKAAAEMMDYEGSGQSVMEMSHRSKVYDKIIKDAEDLVEYFSVFVNFRKLETAGTEVSCRCSLQKLLIESALDMLGKINVMALHETLYAVDHAVNFLIAALLS